MITPAPNDPPKLKDAIAAALDSSPRVRDDWRNAAKFRSVRGSAAAIVAAVGNAAIVFAQAEPLTAKLPHYAAMAILVFACLWSMYGTLTKQRNLSLSQDDETGTE